MLKIYYCVIPKLESIGKFIVWVLRCQGATLLPVCVTGAAWIGRLFLQWNLFVSPQTQAIWPQGLQTHWSITDTYLSLTHITTSDRVNRFTAKQLPQMWFVSQNEEGEAALNGWYWICIRADFKESVSVLRSVFIAAAITSTQTVINSFFMNAERVCVTVKTHTVCMKVLYSPSLLCVSHCCSQPTA